MNQNLFEIYQKLVKKKIRIWKRKDKFAETFLDTSVTDYRNFNMMKLYQMYAIKSLIQKDALLISLKLKIMRQTIPRELTSDEISRMGILYINGPKTFQFAHRTFIEYFVAQYLIDNIYNAEDEPLEEEADKRILVFENFLQNEYIRKFIHYYLQT